MMSLEKRILFKSQAHQNDTTLTIQRKFSEINKYYGDLSTEEFINNQTDKSSIHD